MNLADFYLPRSEYCFPNCDLGALFDEIDEIAEKYSDDYSLMCDAVAVVLYKMIINIKRAVDDSSADICKKYARILIQRQVTVFRLIISAKNTDTPKSYYKDIQGKVRRYSL